MDFVVQLDDVMPCVVDIDKDNPELVQSDSIMSGFTILQRTVKSELDHLQEENRVLRRRLTMALQQLKMREQEVRLSNLVPDSRSPSLSRSHGEEIPAKTKPADEVVEQDQEGPVHGNSSVSDGLGECSNPSEDGHVNHWNKELDRGKTAHSSIFEQDPGASKCKIKKRHREFVFYCLILLNSIFLGVQLQYTYGEGRDLDGSAAIEAGFIAAFLIELFIRYMHEGSKRFLVGEEWAWNAFDATVVTIMVIEWVVDRMYPDSDFVEGMGVLRMVRFLRVVRALRAARVLRILSFFRAGRLLIVSITRGYKLFAWIATIYISLIYVLALIIAGGSLDYCKGSRNDNADLCKHFGSMWLSSVSITKATLGGLRWGLLYDALLYLEFPYIVLFVLYFSFLVGVLTHIITGVFVNLVTTAAEVERNDTFFEDQLRKRENFMTEMVTHFHSLDVNGNGALCKDEIVEMFQNKATRALLASFDLDSNSAETLFDLLDVDKSGHVAIDEFVVGCLKLQGKARAVDLAELRRDLQDQLRVMEHSLKHSHHVSEPMSDDGVASGQASLYPFASERSMRPSVTSRLSAGNSAGPKQETKRPTMLRKGSSLALEVQLNRPKKLIPKTEMRAMLLSELEQVVALIDTCCVHGDWEDPFTKTPVAPLKANLYHFNYYVISPETASEVVILKGLTQGTYAKGSILKQFLPSNSTVLGEAEIVEDASGTEVKVHFVKGQIFGKESHYGTESKLVLHDDEQMDCGHPTEVVNKKSCSFKELLSTTPTKPDWFCCHWWGEPIADFVACCRSHSQVRGKHSYWVCAYANRQHDLGMDISEDPEETAFRRSMKLSVGVLLVLDPVAIPFQRIWCDFELFSIVRDSSKMLDIITYRGKPRLLTEQLLPGEQYLQKTIREAKFPLKLLAKGVQLDLECGKCTVEVDKTNILNSMGKCPKTGLIVDDLRKSNIDWANRSLRGYFAAAAWPQAIKHGCVRNFPHGSKSGRTGVSLPEILVADVDRTTLQLTFSSLDEANDEEMKSIADGLPPNLQSLSLSCESCVNITDSGITILSGRLAQLPLKTLRLDFVSCRKLTDAGVSALAMHLPSTLTDVGLHFAFCPNITNAGLACLSDNLPKAVKFFKGTFRGTKCNKDFDSVQQLKKAAKV